MIMITEIYPHLVIESFEYFEHLSCVRLYTYNPCDTGSWIDAHQVYKDLAEVSSNLPLLTRQ